MAQPIMFLRKDPAALYVCLAHDKPVIGIAKSIYHEFGDGEPCDGYAFKQGDIRYSRQYVLSHLQAIPPRRL